MADLLQAVCPLGDRRDLGAHRAAGAARCRRLRGAGLAGAGRYQCGPRPPACRRRPQGGLAPAASAAQQGLGRSRGGLSTKIQAVGDGRGRPLVTRATPGQTADTTALLGLVDAVKVARPGGIGRPRVRPNYLVADKAYSSRANRAGLRARRIAHTIPERDDQRAHRRRRGRQGGRPVGFCREQYRRRNQVERGFNRRKQLRAVATRYDKLKRRYEATLTIASILDWLRATPDASRS
jgi:transposase